jgi:hypothetical protein
MLKKRYEPNPEDGKLFFQNHLPDRRGGLGLPCPMRTGRVAGVGDVNRV